MLSPLNKTSGIIGVRPATSSSEETVRVKTANELRCTEPPSSESVTAMDARWIDFSEDVQQPVWRAMHKKRTVYNPRATTVFLYLPSEVSR